MTTKQDRKSLFATGAGASLAAVAAILAFAPAASVANDIPGVFEIEPPLGTTFGHGYDVTRRRTMGASCVEFDLQSRFKAGEEVSDAGFEIVTSNSAVSDTMSLSVSASVSATTPKQSGSAKSKTDVASGSSTNQYSQTMLLYSYNRDQPEFLLDVRLKPEFVKLLQDGKVAEFKQRCGDTFVYGVRQGREFYGVASVTGQTMDNWSSFSQSLEGSGEKKGVKVEGAAEYAQAMSQAFGASNISIRAIRIGGSGANPSTVPTLVSTYEGFGSASSKSVVALYVAPYKTYASGYMLEDPLAPANNEAKLAVLASALWDLKALTDDAQFIGSNPGMFALGMSDAKRSQRLSAVQQAKTRWEREFTDLRNKTQGCLEKFTRDCDALVTRYEQRKTLEERSILPLRYNSDCRQSIYVPSSNVETAIGGYQMSTHVKGDTEMDGGPVALTSLLRIWADGHELKATHTTSAQEWKTKDGRRDTSKKRDTEFSGSRTVVIFDLLNPRSHVSSVRGSLSECTYAGTGTSAAEVLSIFQGYTSATSTKSPRGKQKMTGGAKGLLQYAECELDRKGKDTNLACNVPGIKNIPVSLVSNLDIEAEKWKDSDSRKIAGQIASARSAALNQPKSRSGPGATALARTPAFGAAPAEVVNRAISQVATTTGRTDALSKSQAKTRATELSKLQKQLQEHIAKSRR